jgi:hypothetical protein
VASGHCCKVGRKLQERTWGGIERLEMYIEIDYLGSLQAVDDCYAVDRFDRPRVLSQVLEEAGR